MELQPRRPIYKKKYFVVPLTSSVAIHDKQNGEETSVSRNNIIATIMSLFQLLLKKRRRNISRCCQRNMTELKGDQECRNISLFHSRKNANRVLGQQNQTPWKRVTTRIVSLLGLPVNTISTSADETDITNSSILGPYILITWFSDTLYVCPSVSVIGQVSHYINR